MLDRTQITQLLKVNGVDIFAPDDEIKSILLSARWHEKDVNAALTILRENTQTHETHIDTLDGVFHSDGKLKPETISALLGIDIDVQTGQLSKQALTRTQLRGQFGQVFQIALYSICLSMICIIASMWYLHVGMFYFPAR